MLWIIALISVYNIAQVNAKSFKNGDFVPVYVNKVGPFFNPHETYHYYELPVCRPKTVNHKSLTLGELLDGDRMAESLYKVEFRKDVKNHVLCKLQLTSNDIKKLKDAVEDLYYFEFVIDDIPVRGFVGRLEESGFLPHRHKVYLLPHHTFTIEFNGDKIIYASVSTKESTPVSLVDTDDTIEITFTYSVNWVPTTLEYENRAQKIHKDNFFPSTLEIHWLSICNSTVLTFLLMGFVGVIVTRVLRKDFSRYNLSDKENDQEEEEDGWKIIHSDVFRPPPYLNLFAAILGTGSQLIAIATGILVLALLDFFNVHHHGAINSASIILFGLTSCISGYVSAVMYRKLGGVNWVSNINLTASLFLGPVILIWSVVNSISLIYGTTHALPWTTILLLGMLILFCGYPLTILGGIIGKNSATPFDAPCRTKNIPREIPRVVWYKSWVAHCLIGGFLSFSSISVELYYIFSTLWSRQHYTLYGILFIIYFILISVTAFVSIALTYFQLSSEDYRWWWRSICSAGCTGLFVFVYALFYFFVRSNMSGVVQFVQFFGFSLMLCYVFFLSLGTIAFFTSLKFVRYIYVNVKID